MQLRVARLCLDCEEIHDSQRCPVCASEAFSYLTRWVPAPERRAPFRSPQPPRKVMPSRGAVVGYGVAGVAIIGLARWLAKGRKRLEDAALKNAGELK